jgi:RNA polymerase sigma-70 factor (ECF subfamily)
MKTAERINRNDEQLVREYLNGDNDSLGILYNRYYSKVYHKCLSFSGNQDDAFDLAQDVLMKAFSNIESFKGSSKFSTWLFSITTNHCISAVSKSRIERSLDEGTDNHIIADDTDVDELILRKHREETEIKLDEYLMQLPETDRKMLTLKYYLNYSIKDLQKEFNLSASAVKMRLLRARNKIGQIIIDDRAA